MNKYEFDKIKTDNRLYVVQDPMELLWLVNMVKKKSPKVILEIGVEEGGTLKYWEMVSEPGALIIGIDTGSRDLISWGIESSSRDIRYIQGDSHDPSVLAKVMDILDGKAVDFLFIDGDHAYDGVKADWDMYSPLVRDDGAVAFHDCNPYCAPGAFFDTIRGHRKKIVRNDSGVKMSECSGMGVGYIDIRRRIGYCNKAGYDRFVNSVLSFYGEMNRCEKPVSHSEHIRPSRMPTTVLDNPQELPQREPMSISIIIASFNAVHALERTLEAINEQQYPKDKIEVIVVDDASANHYLSYYVPDECEYVNFEGSPESPWDRDLVSQMYIRKDMLPGSDESYTKELDRLSKIFPGLRIGYIRLAEHKTWNRAGAINTASRMAEGDILVFLRGDTLIMPEEYCSYISTHHSVHNNLYLYALTIENKYKIPRDVMSIDWENIGLPEDHWPEWTGSSIRKENWIKIKGYNEQRKCWGGLEEVHGRMADIGMVQAIEPRLVARGFLGMFRFTTAREYYQMLADGMSQSKDAYEFKIPNDENWGQVPISISKEYNYQSEIEP